MQRNMNNEKLPKAKITFSANVAKRFYTKFSNRFDELLEMHYLIVCITELYAKISRKDYSDIARSSAQISHECVIDAFRLLIVLEKRVKSYGIK